MKNSLYDDFWDIEKLVPGKKSKMSKFSTSTKVTELEIDGGRSASEVGGKENKLTFPTVDRAAAVDNIRSYVPTDNMLIRRVTIKPSVDKFDFYDTFRKAALVYFDYKSQKCDFVPFYSYKPQYSQMSTEQKRYYFYWREELRRGNYLKSDYSYVYLYTYEILNLPDKISKEDGVRLLCSVWSAYRRDLPRLDDSFRVWVQDYCLIYQISCPMDLIRGFAFGASGGAYIKEFYLSDIGNEGSRGTDALLSYLSDYDWHMGRYAVAESGEIYKKHMTGAMSSVLLYMWNSGNLRTLESVTESRGAFPGSLCTHSVKCNLEIEYYPISQSSTIRAQVTAAVKYTENKLRALMNVKSRLAVKELDENVKGIIDAYFADIFKKAMEKRAVESKPEYEKLYDAPRSNMSLSEAVEIERASWRVTARLVSESDEESYVMVAKSEKNESEVTDSPTVAPAGETVAQDSSSSFGLSASDISFVSALLKEDTKVAEEICESSGIPVETLCERINEAFADNFGDVVIEWSDGSYRIIEDYLEEINEWLLKVMK